MGLNASAVFAISLMVFGGGDASSDNQRLLHIEVMPMMAAEGCQITAWMAEQYLVPSIEGGERLAYICHLAVPRREFLAMQEEAAAHNADVADTP